MKKIVHGLIMLTLFTFANEDRIALVQKGDTIPLVAPHRVNGGVEFALTPHWRVRFDGIYVGSQYLRRDDANERHRLDPYLSPISRRRINFATQRSSFTWRICLTRSYETYVACFENTIDETGVERFLGPGTPLGAFGGVRVSF